MVEPHASDESFSEHPIHQSRAYSESFREVPRGHAHGGHASALAFTDSEIAYFHGQDLYAAKVVVSLMVGIFSVGVVLYTIVAWTCLR